MNIGESVAVHKVLDLVGAIALLELSPTVDVPSDDDLVEAVRLLAESARKRLGAGPSGDEAATWMRLALQAEPAGEP